MIYFFPVCFSLAKYYKIQCPDVLADYSWKQCLNRLGNVFLTLWGALENASRNFNTWTPVSVDSAISLLEPSLQKTLNTCGHEVKDWPVTAAPFVTLKTWKQFSKRYINRKNKYGWVKVHSHIHSTIGRLIHIESRKSPRSSSSVKKRSAKTPYDMVASIF